MAEEVIEPSEILIDETNPQQDEVTAPGPWLRFIARFFDYSLFGFILWGLRTLTLGHQPLGQYATLLPFEFFVWIPVEAYLLSSWGTTPGKWLLNIQLQPERGKKLDFHFALKRSFLVWFRGLGMDIPVINFFCLLIAYQKLSLLKTTSWDRETRVLVFCRPVATWRLYLVSLVAFGGIVVYYSVK